MINNLITLRPKQIEDALQAAESQTMRFGSSTPLGSQLSKRELATNRLGLLGEKMMYVWALVNHADPEVPDTDQKFAPDVILRKKWKVDVKARSTYALEKAFFSIDPGKAARIVVHSNAVAFFSVNVNGFLEGDLAGILRQYRAGLGGEFLGWMSPMSVIDYIKEKTPLKKDMLQPPDLLLSSLPMEVKYE